MNLLQNITVSVEFFLHFAMAKNKNENKKKPAATSSRPNPADSISLKAREPREEYTMSSGAIIVEQNMEMKKQDDQLVDLEASISSLRDASVAINAEVSLQSRLLDDVHVSVDRVQERQLGTQDRLRQFIRTGGTCKLWLLIVGLLFILVLLLSVLR